MKSTDKFKYISIFAIILVLLLSVETRADKENEDALGVLAAAKMAGACGILDSMIYFQKSTQIDNGEVFIGRFWTMEAARLGWTLEEYSNTCNSATKLYNTMVSATEKIQEEK